MRCKNWTTATRFLETPPDPRSGATSIALDPLQWNRSQQARNSGLEGDKIENSRGGYEAAEK
jgi:hypothetical protein